MRLFILLANLILLFSCPSMVLADKHFKSSFKSFSIPAVELVLQDGQKVNLPDFLSAHEPFVLSFIFTTCTTVCPIMSATMAHLRKELGDDGKGLQLISVSIDPEYDTPRRLRDYAKRYRAGAQWSFLTGKIADIQNVQKTFTGFVSDKMDHWPVYIFKAPGKDEWLVVDGLVSGKGLASEYRLLMKSTGG